MHRLKVLNQMQKALIPRLAVAGTVTAVTVAAFGATKVVLAADAPPPPPPPPEDCDPNKPLIRARDLPIYYDPDSKLIKKKECKEEEYPDDILMCAVKWSRAEVWKAKKEIDNLKSRASDFIETGKSHASTGLQQLYEPENVNQRYGVIGAGTVLGFLYGLRGGFFKKLFYTSVGALGATTLCYPEETAAVANPLFTQAYDLVVIANEFFHAAVKDLTGTELSMPEFIKMNPLETVKEWVGSSTTDGDSTSKTSTSDNTSSSQIASVKPSVSPSSGSMPMPPLEKPSKSESEFYNFKNSNVNDQSNPADKDMYSTRD